VILKVYTLSNSYSLNVPAAINVVGDIRMAETISVQIHGSEYKLRGDDAALVHNAAGMVNEQMKYVAGKAPTQPLSTVAVLAALNTAELLLTEQERSRREAVDLVRRIDSLAGSLQELIDQEP
jgi:cell division protein ZapA (FtsZ GTPase activity inhibitor)